MSNNGRDYEEFVASLQQALFESEKWTELHNITIERNKKITDNCGIDREFDLYWEYELAGITYKTIIECKDYASKVTIEKIDALLGKLRDIPDIKPIFATKTGYQSGAKTKAERNKVELLIVREENDTDWNAEDGTPLIKYVNVNIHIMSEATIAFFRPYIDAEWAKANTNIDLDKLKIEVRSDLAFVEDIDRSDKYTLKELQERFTKENEDDFGEHHVTYKYKDAYLCFDGIKLKIMAIELKYVIPKPIISPVRIDFSKELVGVVEYLGRKSKTMIFKDHVVKNWGQKI
ncbi:restriction endonuclease [Salinivibrio sp. YCSC6]|uniref:restriction endonuclease n=1 Tax=Salinivibrio sp. YCSC6 TaxID=2003370 RepID=UPI000BBC3C35|nr:restriction endonuclease [Salinivibrio sp. YCSC6]PCE65138.1 restriction endonuclease [Salinivibrio sp. YCSC6]QCF37815.1 restriction endonuclease [Salinivibrio sp. YCSC6]